MNDTLDMQLLITQDEFNTKLKEFASKADELNAIPASTTDVEFTAFLTSYRAWKDECAAFLKESFSGADQNDFSDMFKNAGAGGYHFPRPEIYQKVQHIKSLVKAGKMSLSGVESYLSISDTILRPQIIIDEKRNTWTIEQKKIFLLSKLNDLGQDSHFDLNYIYRSNGLIKKSNSEPNQIGHLLLEHDFIKLFGGTLACITIHGIAYLEEINAQITEEKKESTINADIEKITEKLDKLTDLVNQNNWGNEIIFDEIQQMRDAGKVLNWKNWQELAKGKFLSLAQSNLEDFGKEKLKAMFNAVVDEGSKMIGL